MNPSPVRRTIKPGGPAGRHELATALNAVWVGEAVRPSRFLIVAATDFADGPAFDNRAGGFSGLEPSWGERVVRVSDVLLRVLEHGGAGLGTHPPPGRSPKPAPRPPPRAAAESGSIDRLRTAEVEALPAAGVYGDGFAVAGAVAFADAGPDFAGEGVVFEIDPVTDRRDTLRTVFEGLFT